MLNGWKLLRESMGELWTDQTRRSLGWCRATVENSSWKESMPSCPIQSKPWCKNAKISSKTRQIEYILHLYRKWSCRLVVDLTFNVNCICVFDVRVSLLWILFIKIIEWTIVASKYTPGTKYVPNHKHQYLHIFSYSDFTK